ncbi:MAG: gerKA [Bacilli bacterium]|nr:gerKA [Bacilli bacterium]
MLRKLRKPRLLGAGKDLEKTLASTALVDTNETLSTDIIKNEQKLREIFSNCFDIVFRPITVHGQTRMLLVYVDGLNDIKQLNQVVLKPTMFEGLPEGLGKLERLGEIVEQQLVAVARTKTVMQLSEVVQSVLTANVAILADGESIALIADIKSWAKRAVEEPASEPVVRGPRDGFTETLRTNTSMLRLKVKSPRFKMEAIVVGNVSQTDIVIAYIDGIANESVLEEVRQRVNRIQIDGIIESGYVEEFIEDAPFSPFPTVQNTERPDVVAASLLEGKVAVLIDGTPFALVVPFTFWAALQSAEDYYERFIYATFIRWVRFLLLNMALFLPSLYVAVTTFHPQMIPTNLLLSFAAAREQSPFPAMVEALIMELMFEGLREAGVRLPKAVGSAVSIVGALVIGQAAVQAGIVSAPMVIVVATTGIASFGIPRYNFGIAYRLLRFPMLILAGMFGLFGVTAGALALLIHLVSLRSFGIPYLSPLAPQNRQGIKDIMVRMPRWALHSRPELIVGEDTTRVPKGQKPGPNRGGGT